MRVDAVLERVQEGAFAWAARAFDASKHPRGRRGRFDRVLDRLAADERKAPTIAPHSRFGTSICNLYPGADVAVHRALPAALRAVTSGGADRSDRLAGRLEATSPRWGRRARAAR